MPRGRDVKRGRHAPHHRDRRQAERPALFRHLDGPGLPQYRPAIISQGNTNRLIKKVICLYIGRLVDELFAIARTIDPGTLVLTSSCNLQRQQFLHRLIRCLGYVGVCLGPEMDEGGALRRTRAGLAGPVEGSCRIYVRYCQSRCIHCFCCSSRVCNLLPGWCLSRKQAGFGGDFEPPRLRMASV
jgi:hypothetical protein